VCVTRATGVIEDLERAAEAIRKQGGEARAAEVDVTSAGSCNDLIELARERFGGVDVLVNNAGLVKAGAIASYDEQDWDRIFAVNVKGVFLASRAAIPTLAEQGGGAIVNVASIAGKKGYAASRPTPPRSSPSSA
jgi:NAD(P)-dependent dehydrogenase (short-subunit alcohol dehydrogenase family)